MPTEIVALYREWLLTLTDHAVTGIKFDNSGERFEISRLPDFETTLRAAKGKVKRLEGEEVWDQAYEDEALK